MELKKKYIGSFVFIARLNREVKVCEENKSILIQNNQREFFVTPQPKKVEPKKAVPKLDKKETKKSTKKKTPSNASTPTANK
jgi:hypothetical protein